MTARHLDVGVEIEPTHKVVYQRALAKRSFSHDSIHSDEHTRRHGYPGALVSAYVLAGLMSEPMVGFFGQSWFTTGRLELTFIGTGVQQGDRVTCRAVVTEVSSGRVTFEVWMEKEDGTKVVIGRASGEREEK